MRELENVAVNSRSVKRIAQLEQDSSLTFQQGLSTFAPLSVAFPHRLHDSDTYRDLDPFARPGTARLARPDVPHMARAHGGIRGNRLDDFRRNSRSVRRGLERLQAL